MKKLNMSTIESVTFEDGCNMYLDDCRQRNLREGTINHYKQSYTQFYKYFDANMPVERFSSEMYKQYVMYLKNTLQNDVSINSYLRDLITTLHFLMNQGYVAPSKMQAIKVDKTNVETYSDDELKILLQKPNIKKCSFIEYQSWVMTNFLFSTGVRQRSLMHIKVKDIDFDNCVVYVNVTKNRKPLIVPVNVERSLITSACVAFTKQMKSAVRHFYVEMMGLIGAGNNPMVGMTVAVAVAIEESNK